MKVIQTITETKPVTEQVVVRQRQNECRESVNDGDNECDNACETVSDSYRGYPDNSPHGKLAPDD